MDFKKPPNKKAQSQKAVEPDNQAGLVNHRPYDPSEIILIGHEMGSKTSATVKDDAELIERSSGVIRVKNDFVNEVIIEAVAKFSDDKPLGDTPIPAVALIYAYGYEGHTYRLSKPRIMVVVGEAEDYVPSGQDPSASITGPLYMWRLSKHDETISIEVESGELKTLVLEANQPGNRAVNSYSAHMQMSHRGGKLSG